MGTYALGVAIWLGAWFTYLSVAGGGFCVNLSNSPNACVETDTAAVWATGLVLAVATLATEGMALWRRLPKGRVAKWVSLFLVCETAWRNRRLRPPCAAVGGPGVADAVAFVAIALGLLAFLAPRHREPVPDPQG